MKARGNALELRLGVSLYDEATGCFYGNTCNSLPCIPLPLIPTPQEPVDMDIQQVQCTPVFAPPGFSALPCIPLPLIPTTRVLFR